MGQGLEPEDVPRPSLPGLTWRRLDGNDLPALVELSRKCLAADGGLPSLFELEAVSGRYFPEEVGVQLGAFTGDGNLVASATVHLYEGSPAARVIITGQVQPDHRRRGVGSYLMDWSDARGLAILPSIPAASRVLRINTETLTSDADGLYRSRGFRPADESLVMRRDLRTALPDPSFPAGTTVAEWRPELAQWFFQAYEPAFRDRPGFPGWNDIEWTIRVTSNDLVPHWTLLVSAPDTPLGYVIGCSDASTTPGSGFVWQIGVIPRERRRGIASALLVESMRRMQAEGAPYVHLTVHTDNPSAIRAYERLGFEIVGRRAEYERAA